MYDAQAVSGDAGTSTAAGNASLIDQIHFYQVTCGEGEQLAILIISKMFTKTQHIYTIPE